jgi:hypothetical protein
MISVVSHAWLRSDERGDAAVEDHMRAYAQISEAFDVVHREVGGYCGRRLMHSLDNSGHVLNIRWFDRVEDYERLTKHPDYASWIGRLSEHVEARNPEKEYFEIVLDTVQPTDLAGTDTTARTVTATAKGPPPGTTVETTKTTETSTGASAETTIETHSGLSGVPLT